MNPHDHPEREHKNPLFSRAGLVACGFLAAIAFLVATGHTAHVLGFLPYLLLLACPLMHIFMHGGHGGSHAGGESDGKEAKPHERSKGGCH